MFLYGIITRTLIIFSREKHVVFLFVNFPSIKSKGLLLTWKLSRRFLELYFFIVVPSRYTSRDKKIENLISFCIWYYKPKSMDILTCQNFLPQFYVYLPRTMVEVIERKVLQNIKLRILLIDCFIF